MGRFLDDKRFLNRRVSRWWLLLVVVLTAIVALAALEPMVDDAYIIFRYVERILNGEGFTYNDGELVEGTTGLLWVMLLVGAGKFVPIPLAAILLNLSVILLLPLALDGLLKELSVSLPFRVTALFLYATSTLFFKVLFLGLEFGLYIFLLLLFLRLLLVAIDYPAYAGSNSRAAAGAGLVAGLLFAARPESILLLPSLAFLLWLFVRKGDHYKKALWVALAVFAAIVATITLWRFAYFGALIPNSVQAKAISPSLSNNGAIRLLYLVKDSTFYVVSAYWHHPALLLALLLAIYTFVRSRYAIELAYVATPILLQHGVVLINGGDWMPYSRFLYSHIPLYIVLTVIAIQMWPDQTQIPRKYLLTTFVLLFAFFNLFSPTYDPRDILAAVGRAPDRNWPTGELYNQLGIELEKRMEPGGIIAPEAIGRIGYTAASLYIHDQTGLVDRKLANSDDVPRSVYGRTDWEYSISLTPLVIIQHFWPSQLSANMIDDYRVYCAGPYAIDGNSAWLFVLIHRSAAEKLEPALDESGYFELVADERHDVQGASTDYCSGVK